jgi:hypothetical protein
VSVRTRNRAGMGGPLAKVRRVSLKINKSELPVAEAIRRLESSGRRGSVSRTSPRSRTWLGRVCAQPTICRARGCDPVENRGRASWKKPPEKIDQSGREGESERERERERERAADLFRKTREREGVEVAGQWPARMCRPINLRIVRLECLVARILTWGARGRLRAIRSLFPSSSSFSSSSLSLSCHHTPPSLPPPSAHRPLLLSRSVGQLVDLSRLSLFIRLPSPRERERLGDGGDGKWPVTRVRSAGFLKRHGALRVEKAEEEGRVRGKARTDGWTVVNSPDVFPYPRRVSENWRNRIFRHDPASSVL